MEFVAHASHLGLRSQLAIFARFLFEHPGIHQPRDVCLINAFPKVLNSLVARFCVENFPPSLWSNLSANRMCLPFLHRSGARLLQCRHVEPVILFFTGVERCPGKGIVMISEWSLRVRGFAPCLFPSRIAKQDGCDLECCRIRIHHFRLYHF